MKTVLIILVAHVVGVVVLIGLGLALNDAISERYDGVITVLSLGVGVYTISANCLYRWNRRFYLFASRLWLSVVRTHTFWHAHFHFRFSENCQPEILDAIWDRLREGEHGKAVKKSSTPSTITVTIDELMSVKFRIQDASLSVSLEQKLLVPAHLYEKYRKRLISFADDISSVTSPSETRCNLQISFGDGVKNPYYGFFVRHTPASLLEDFQVSFKLSDNSKCRIEAGKDHVNIEATKLSDMSEALSQVLSLQAFPSGVAQ